MCLYILGVSNVNYFFPQINRIIRFDPNFLPSSQCGRISVVAMSVAWVAAQQVDYFENTVMGRITELWIAVFLGYFYNVSWPPKVYEDK